MLTTIENLQIGDEILTSAGSNIRYLKILRLPQLSKTKVKWNTKAPLYKAVKCSTRKEIKITSLKYYPKSLKRRSIEVAKASETIIKYQKKFS